MSSPSAPASSDARALDSHVITREDAEDEEYRKFMTEEANKARHEVSGGTQKDSWVLPFPPPYCDPPALFPPSTPTCGPPFPSLAA